MIHISGRFKIQFKFYMTNGKKILAFLYLMSSMRGEKGEIQPEFSYNRSG